MEGDEARMSTKTHPQPPSNTSSAASFSPPPLTAAPSSSPPSPSPPPLAHCACCCRASAASASPSPSPLSPPSLAVPSARPPWPPLPLELFPLPPPPLPPAPPPLRPPPRPPLEDAFSAPRRCCPPPLPPPPVPPPVPPPERDEARNACCCFSRSRFISVSHLISATYKQQRGVVVAGVRGSTSAHSSEGSETRETVIASLMHPSGQRTSHEPINPLFADGRVSQDIYLSCTNLTVHGTVTCSSNAAEWRVFLPR